MIGQVFVTLAWKLHVILSLKILYPDLPDVAGICPHLCIIAVSLLMVFVVQGSRVSMALINEKN